MSVRRLVPAAALMIAALGLQGCLAVAAGGAVVGVAGAVVGATAKVGGAVVGAAIPDGDVDCSKKKNRKKKACRE
jgi:NAD/NADP transhydrogenase alpha subunit